MINVKSKQAEGYKPTLYGGLDNPDDTITLLSKNPIYSKWYVTRVQFPLKLNGNWVLLII